MLAVITAGLEFLPLLACSCRDSQPRRYPLATFGAGGFGFQPHRDKQVRLVRQGDDVGR